MNTDQFPYAHQDIGYLLTAYADSQLAPDGVMWVEEQLDRNAELRSKLKEIRGLQAALRQAFAGNAPTYELDLPRRDALMEQAALAALAEKKKSNIISFKTAFRIAAAASVVLCVWAISMPNLLESRAPMMTKSSGDDLNDVDQEFPPMRVTTTAAPVQSDPLAAPPVQNGIAIAPGSAVAGKPWTSNDGGATYGFSDSKPAAENKSGYTGLNETTAYNGAITPKSDRVETTTGKAQDELSRAKDALAKNDPKTAEALAWNAYESDRTNEAARKLYLDARRAGQNNFDGRNRNERLEQLSRTHEEVHKSLEPQNEILVKSGKLENSPGSKPKPTAAAPTAPATTTPAPTTPAAPSLRGVAKPAVVLPSSPPMSVASAPSAQAPLKPAEGEKFARSDSTVTPAQQPLPKEVAENRAGGPLAGVNKKENAAADVGGGRVETFYEKGNWDKEHKLLSESTRTSVDGFELVTASPDWSEMDKKQSEKGKEREQATANTEIGSGGGGFAFKDVRENDVRDNPVGGTINSKEAQELTGKNNALNNSLELTRQSNNEKTHIAQVDKAVAMQLNRKLADVEDNYNKSVTGDELKTADLAARAASEEIIQLRRDRQVYLRQIPADGIASNDKGRENVDEKILAAEQRLKAALAQGGKLKDKGGVTDGREQLAAKQAASVAVMKERYPKIAAEITDEKVSASFSGDNGKKQNEYSKTGLPKKSYQVLSLAQSMQSFPGPDLDIPEPGGVGNRLLPPIEPELTELINVIQSIIAPDSWNKNGTGIEMYNGQLVVTNTAEIQQQVEDLIATLRRQQGLKQPTDPVASLAFLQQNMTGSFKHNIEAAYQLMGGSEVIYHYSAAAEPYKYRQAHLLMNDEPVSRGILRIARSANLQAQFTGGIVHLDVAQRPLDPTDSQGFELPTFRTLMGTSPMQHIATDPVQTVAIDADTASFAYAKARIAAGETVDASTIKPEHFINAMPMDYPQAQGPEAFSLYAEAAPSPFARVNTAWGARTAIVSIGAVAKPAAADERRPLALTLAVDCSGSMAQPGALERIKIGLETLIGHLRAEDRVSIVAFGDQARVVLPATPGNDRKTVLTALQALATGGATNAAEGISLAYQLAAETAAPGVESRVLLATDGGTVAGADDLLRRVTAFKNRGITLVVVGCGQTYRAGPLQELATKGDGQHFFVGSNEEAQTLFSTTLLPDRLAVLAKDAKLQVTWNPQRISHARLIGYDQRRLATKDFRDNTVDAGELSQDTQVTAMFEVLLVDGGTGPLGSAAVRYYDTRREQVRELTCPLPGSILASQPSDRLRLLACAAATAEWLQRGWWSNVHLITPAEISAQLKRCPQPIAAELRQMVEHKAE